MEQTKLKRAVFFSLFMMVAEIVGGLVANSLSILTDAAHMMSDVAGFVISFVSLQIVRSMPTDEYTYGFRQAEVVGALISIAIVWALTGMLLVWAVGRFVELEPVRPKIMLGVATMGLVVNLILMQILGHGHSHDGGYGHTHGDHGHCHVHGDGGSDDDDDEENDAQKAPRSSLAFNAALIHVIGDIVQSLGVCVAALLIWWEPFDLGKTSNNISRWNYADPACTVLFGILVFLTTRTTAVRIFHSLMVGAPGHINVPRLKARLKQCCHVEGVHDFHLWGLGTKEIICTAHLVVRGGENAPEVLKEATRIAEGVGITQSTFQTEIEGDYMGCVIQGQSSRELSSELGPGHGHHDGHSHEHGQCDGHGHGH